MRYDHYPLTYSLHRLRTPASLLHDAIAHHRAVRHRHEMEGRFEEAAWLLVHPVLAPLRELARTAQRMGRRPETPIGQTL
jgi:hypothetical protein